MEELAPLDGADTAAEIFVAVGAALSWWEGAEDERMGLFKHLVGQGDPSSCEKYVGQQRNRRAAMLREALTTYSDQLTPTEHSALDRALAELDELSKVRNEIAHGHCTRANISLDGRTIRSGHYLYPAMSEGRWLERGPRFAHNLQTIADFTSKVRAQRAVILDIVASLVMRKQQQPRNDESAPSAGLHSAHDSEGSH